MEYDGELTELLNYQFPELSIDDLMNNIEAADHDHNINGVLELGFEADNANTKNNEGIQEERNVILESDVGLDAAIPIPADVGIKSRDDPRNDARSAPRKIRKKPRAWTEQEHRQFLKAIKDGLMGQWKKISQFYIPTRTPQQITSHAQKFFLRMKNENKKRKSINDNINDNINDTYNDKDKWSNEGLSSPCYNNNQVNMAPPMPPPATLMPMNMSLPPVYDAIFSFYVNQIRRVEEEKKMVMRMLNYCRSQYNRNMASPMINGPAGLFPGPGSYYDGSYGFGALEPYSNVGISSSFAANATTTHNGHLQWVNPESLYIPLQYDQGHDHVELP